MPPGAVPPPLPPGYLGNPGVVPTAKLVDLSSSGKKILSFIFYIDIDFYLIFFKVKKDKSFVIWIDTLGLHDFILFDSGDRDFMRYGHNRVHAETKSLTIDAFFKAT